MKHSRIIATLTGAAISLSSITTSAQADRDTDNLIKLLLGAAAVGVIANEIKSNKKDNKSSTDSQYTHRHNGNTHKHSVARQHSHSSWFYENQRQEARKRELARLKAERARAQRARAERARKEALRAEREREHWMIKQTRERANATQPRKAKSLPLPGHCKRKFRTSGKKRTAYSQRCLIRDGYAISDSGKVTHRKWRGRAAKPILM
ncbi:hypothetical protein GCM10007939_19390 [Amylibacter marinus]|uniref:Uncharacterized protein n=1 Tax=Amylibacter marinus TaxID=1475483 RepID=A0ABQ5VW34_9RHOB|nr:hypothetical protein [Amylibacter marinus]GLQ35656.1 hypothetical protein GCM10007939_19390 [Amylibacter marinus]